MIVCVWYVNNLNAKQMRTIGLWDVRLLQQCWWRCKSSWIWYHADLQTVTDIPDELAASVIRSFQEHFVCTKDGGSKDTNTRKFIRIILPSFHSPVNIFMRLNTKPVLWCYDGWKNNRLYFEKQWDVLTCHNMISNYGKLDNTIRIFMCQHITKPGIYFTCKSFWQWYITLGITNFQDFLQHILFKENTFLGE
jgi:hypothetical protein